MQFVFKFAAVLKYRRSRREQVQLLLAEVQADAAALRGRREAVEAVRYEQLEQLRRLGTGGAVDVDRSAARRFHAAQLTGELAVVDRQQDVVARQMQLCRAALAKADQEVRLLEKLEEKQRAEFLHRQERRAALEREEVWLARRSAELGT